MYDTRARSRMSRTSPTLANAAVTSSDSTSRRLCDKNDNEQRRSRKMHRLVGWNLESSRIAHVVFTRYYLPPEVQRYA